MTELFIGTLSATAAAENHDGDGVSLAGTGNLPTRVQNMLAHLADHRLEEVLAAAEIPAGEWCLRRLDLRLALNPERPGPALETQWAHAVVQELRQRIDSPSDEVLHFPRISDALNDLAASLAAGRTDHAWAWRQLGLLTPEDPDPAGAPAPVLLAVLRRWPEQALAAIVSAVQAHGAAPLLRLLAGPDWIELAAIVAAAAGASRAAVTIGSFSLAATRTSGQNASHGKAPDGNATLGNGIPGSAANGNGTDWHDTNGNASRISVGGPGPDDAAGANRHSDHGGAGAPSAAGHLAPPATPGPLQVVDAQVVDEQMAGVLTLDLTRRSRLAGALLRSGLRPDVSTATAWALLAAAEADAGLLRRPDAPGILRSLASRFLALNTSGASLRDAARMGSAAQPAAGYPGAGPTALDGTDGRAAVEGTRAFDSGDKRPDDRHGRDVPDAEADNDGLPANAGPACSDAPACGMEPAGAPEPGTEPAEGPARGADPADAGQDAAREDSKGIPEETAVPTLWAGLPFLLAIAGDAGIPDLLLTDPALAARPLRWIIHRLGQLLVPVAPDDPAVMALAGLSSAAEPPDGGRPAPGNGTTADGTAGNGTPRYDTSGDSTPEERTALEQHAARWATATAGRLGRPHLEPFGVVGEIAFRRGAVLAQTGWIEVHLSLRDVDVDVRRAGLDIDPGWVPWLAVVVRFVYE
ncbi:hypothetical protein [Paenarthrobacter sp. PH39-S1]|uniref:hypothetical protein n=1 Tax=Paenarthrobacter sp. PH39-S1 TaxID=3046204 RepID=UPI0024B9E6F7|nr:hypothetical protein [Paenarthrobacter sp. PH39-S1]MDJ0355286.1 hypothetical protein [Paenarthrobacter sp. PH39-S1]